MSRPDTAAPVTGTGQNLLQGAALMLGASVSFGLMGLFVKLATREVSALGLTFGRSLLVAVLGFAWMMARRLPFGIARPKLLIWRCVTGSAAMVLYFIALSALPLSTATTLQYLSPVFVALLSGLVVGERVSSATLALVALAFVGTALVLSPELDAPRIEVGAAIISALLMAFAYLGVRSLRHYQSADSIVFYFAIFTTVGAAPWAPELLDVSSHGLLAVLGVGATAFVGQLLMTHAYRFAEAALVSAFSYFTPIVGVLLGVIVLGETLGPATGLGIVICIGAGAALSVVHRRPPTSTTSP